MPTRPICFNTPTNFCKDGYPNAACVVYTGPNLICSGITTNDRLDAILEKIDAAICDSAASIVYLEPGAAIDITGAGTQFNPFIISHEDTSSITELEAVGAQVIEIMSFDTFGHVLSVSLRDLSLGDIGYTVPTWQQTLDAGSTLNKNNTVDVAGFNFSMIDAGSFLFAMDNDNLIRLDGAGAINLYSLDSVIIDAPIIGIGSNGLIILSSEADIQQALKLTGDTQGTVGTIFVPNEDDYTTVNLATSTSVQLHSIAGQPVTITGLQTGVHGRILITHNVGVWNIIFKNEDVASIATNRFSLNGDLVLKPGDSIAWQYFDIGGITPRWRALGITGSGVGGDWAVLGNGGTVDGTNFIGTTDNIPFNIRVNNEKAGRLSSGGQTFYGYQAGNVNTIDGLISSIGFGLQALAFNTTGIQNTAIGNQALYRNIGANSNVAVGNQAMRENLTSANNVAIGMATLSSLTGGSGSNIAIGGSAMLSSTTAHFNTVVGYNAMLINQTGGLNAAFGMNTLLFNTGDKNTAIGTAAMEKNTTGNHNTAVGYDALYQNTTGVWNVAIGWNALAGVDTSSYNIGIGHRAGGYLGGTAMFNTGSDYNIFIGHDAGYSASQYFDATNSIAIGKGTFTTASNQVVIGNDVTSEFIINSLAGIIVFKDVSLAGASNGDVWTLIDDSTGEGGWATSAAGYTDEQAQDAVGLILLDGNGFDFIYDDNVPSISLTTLLAQNSVPFIGAAGALVEDNTDFNYISNVLTLQKSAAGSSTEVPRLLIKTNNPNEEIRFGFEELGSTSQNYPRIFFNYPDDNAINAGFINQLAGVSQWFFGMSNEASFGGTVDTDSGRFLGYYDFVGGTYRYGFNALGDMYLGSSNTVYNTRIGPSGYVFNEGGIDIDFRIEGNDTIDLFSVDASTNRVGVATIAPSGVFEVFSSIGGYGADVTSPGMVVAGTFTYIAAGYVGNLGLIDDTADQGADPAGLHAGTNWRVDLGSGNPKHIRRISLKQLTGFTNDATCKLEWSDDDTIWTQTGSNFILLADDNSTQLFDFATSGSHRYWKISFGLGTTGGNAHIEEVEMYESVAGFSSFIVADDGKVGVSKVVPTEALDIVGNVRWSGALMPNNLPGAAGQFLTSAGAGGPNTWTTPSFEAILTFDNGLTRTLDNVQWGGTLLHDTIIDGAENAWDVSFIAIDKWEVNAAIDILLATGAAGEGTKISGKFGRITAVSPAQIVSNQNDYSPIGLNTAAVLRLNSDAARDITGLAGGYGGRELHIFNNGSFNITLKNLDVASAAANQFLLNADAVITPDSGLTIWYDDISDKWRAVGGAGGGSDTNFATTDLTATGDRVHDWNGFDLGIGDIGTFVLSASNIEISNTPNAITGLYITATAVELNFEDTNGISFSTGGGSIYMEAGAVFDFALNATAELKVTNLDNQGAAATRVVVYEATTDFLQFRTLAEFATDLGVISGGGYTVHSIDNTDSPYTITETAGEVVILADATAGAITVDLPTAVGNTAKYTVKKTDSSANAVTLDGSGGELIDDSTTATIGSQYSRIVIINNNADWFIVN